jgi:hypothetical protein
MAVRVKKTWWEHGGRSKNLDPYLLNFVGVNINVELSSALKLVKLRLIKVHNKIVLGKLNLFMTYLHYCRVLSHRKMYATF